jgi:hypothetical protein
MSQGSWDPRDEDRPWTAYKPDHDNDDAWSVGRHGWGGGIVDYVKTGSGDRQWFGSRAEAEPVANRLNHQ